MRTALFDYELPPHFIAQTPAEPRDSSRLLVLHRTSGQIEHRAFYDVGDYLRRGDLLVANDSRVLPGRLLARKPTGGAIELLLLRQLDQDGCEWECLMRGKNIQAGLTITQWTADPSRLEQTTESILALPPLSATVIALLPSGTRTVRFSAPVRPYLEVLGATPLPPYISGYHGDPERYQTVYSRSEGSAAAPTAGLHLTPELLLRLRSLGVVFFSATLHVGLDTFKPVESEELEDHPIHSEWATLSAATAQRINQAALAGGRIVAVGTTTVRTLEWAAHRAVEGECPWQRVGAFGGAVNLYIYPGYRFRAVDALITNFHLPRSSLLMLVSALIAQSYPEDPDQGRRMLLNAYEVAKRENYRFFSFGDAMLIL